MRQGDVQSQAAAAAHAADHAATPAAKDGGIGGVGINDGGNDALAALAPGYDATEAANPLMQAMRRRMWGVLDAQFPRPATLLDIGAGTGIDALRMASRGHTVLAAEPSPAMRAVLERKAAQAATAGAAGASGAGGAGGADGGHVRPLPLAAGELGRLLHREPGLAGSLDGAYSSFGAWNLEARPADAVAALARLLQPGAPLVLCTLNRWALAHAAANLALLRPRRAAMRLRRAPTWTPPGAPAPLPVRYDTIAGVRRLLAPAFTVASVEALPFAAPAPSAWPHLQGHPVRMRILAALHALDRALAPRWPANRLGDHLLVVARRRA